MMEQLVFTSKDTQSKHFSAHVNVRVSVTESVIT